jgi:predicted CoA-substrate-specific enzyme activase
MVSQVAEGASSSRTHERYLGIDLGAETIKLVELCRQGDKLSLKRRLLVEHGKHPSRHLKELLVEWGWDTLSGVAVTGRLGRQLKIRQIPCQQALAHGYRFFSPKSAATVLSIGSHGFSALELRENGQNVFHENSRCSQGTGNFLRQLVERFSLSVEEASELCADVATPSVLSGRCPVILKTDMTHLANKGERREEILAGLFDALSENVLTLVKPGVSPSPVVLAGGVSRSRRIQSSCARILEKSNYQLQVMGEDGVFLEATGAALLAGQHAWSAPALSEVFAQKDGVALEQGESLLASLGKVRRMPRVPWGKPCESARAVILGFDIGSTGSKAVAIDATSSEVLWEGYCQTHGTPVKAAQELVETFLASSVGKSPVVVLGVTGSGREIVGSLMTTCYQSDAVFVLNEIAAHAAGACHFDPRVDTIFEIGGQDAKYIRLEGGRVIDCAMNEACSAGTGSFIEEQGRKFAGIRDVVHLAEEALKAEQVVSLGQHCSVFMAEIIDEAVAAGMEPRNIIAGLYDSIIQNYLNRVKGCRSVGSVIFCQGMPFASDALAAAVARQTESEVIIPPNPGTVGALGIALLARKDMTWQGRPVLDLQRLQTARVEGKTTFVCKSAAGCGGTGNKCRIDCLRTVVDGRQQSFTWGGVCSLYDQGVRKRKLPDLAPDPFAEREAYMHKLAEPYLTQQGRKKVAMTDEFMLKSLFPFFACYVHSLGFDVVWKTGARKEELKRGVQESNVPFCAPMQLFHGVASTMCDTDADYVLLPIMRTTVPMANESCFQTCPIVQGAPDLLRQDLKKSGNDERLLTPEFRFGVGDYASAEFREGCESLAKLLGVRRDRWQQAWRKACVEQKRFDAHCHVIGKHALHFCSKQGVIPVVVLGRPYTIYNPILNSNVPALLREQGSMAIPVDCYPTPEETPIFERMYWGSGQRILRAAHHVRGAKGAYAVYCSNYSCGPDSFNLHLFAYAMEGKPFAVIETDGHTGDAGTKTRLEAFLYCVEQDRSAGVSRHVNAAIGELDKRNVTFTEAKALGHTMLVPWMGPSSDVLAAAFRASGVRAETLAMPDRESLRLGRRYTSGKECLPMCLTLGRLIERLQRDPEKKFVCMMPQTNGPCRFGMYNLLDKIILERLGFEAHCSFLTPHCNGYFEGLPSGFPILLMVGVMASDYLYDALLAVRPMERKAGAANAIYKRYQSKLISRLERYGKTCEMSQTKIMWEVLNGTLFGLKTLLSRASAELASVRKVRKLPVVLIVGEIYVRGDAFANDGIVEKLESMGCSVRVSAIHEWLLFVDDCNRKAGSFKWSEVLRGWVERRIRCVIRSAMGSHLDWHEAPHMPDIIEASKPYVLGDLGGDAVLALGRSLCDWVRKEIDAVVNVGPMECMPTRFVESQLCHIAEREGLPSLTLSYNGDPLTLTALENFVFDLHSRPPRRNSAS